MKALTLLACLALVLPACQPAALHQGGVVFAAPPNGFTITGQLQTTGAVAASDGTRVQLVGLQGQVAEAAVAPDGTFQLTYAPDGGAALVAALHVVQGSLQAYIEYDTGGGTLRHWLRHEPGKVYGLGMIQLAAGAATCERNPLLLIDSDGDGTDDAHDLDDDNDGMLDKDDPDDLNLGHRDDSDPLGLVAR